MPKSQVRDRLFHKGNDGVVKAGKEERLTTVYINKMHPELTSCTEGTGTLSEFAV